MHVIGPEMGYTQPGMTIVCGDSHTSTHGAFGALAFGIGTSEVEHVLATQTLPQTKPKTMAVTVDGELPLGCSAKDIILAIINRIGTGGGVGHVIEYRGSAIRALSMEGRMTICNMSIEGGARAGMVAPDDTTFAYVEGRPHAPKGADWEAALDDWRTLPTDDGASFDTEVDARRRDAAALRELGHQPGAVGHDRRHGPRPGCVDDPRSARPRPRALAYMDLEPGTPIRDIRPDTVFIGSCTNSRIEDLRVAADVVARPPGRRRACAALVVPGSVAVKIQAEQEGLERGVRGGRVRVARRGLLDVPRDEPRHPAAGRAQRLDQQPQLRGPAGQGRAHAPGQPARSPPPPRSPATSRPRRTCS